MLLPVPSGDAFQLSNPSRVNLSGKLCSRRGRHGPPYAHRFRGKPVECRSGNQMALDVESVIHGGMSKEKSLLGPDRSNTLHSSFTSLNWLVSILRPVVFPTTKIMVLGKSQLLQSLAPIRLGRTIDTTISQQNFNNAKADVKPEIQPDDMLNDLWRKSMAGIGNFLHPMTLLRRLSSVTQLL